MRSLLSLMPPLAISDQPVLILETISLTTSLVGLIASLFCVRIAVRARQSWRQSGHNGVLDILSLQSVRNETASVIGQVILCCIAGAFAFVDDPLTFEAHMVYYVSSIGRICLSSGLAYVSMHNLTDRRRMAQLLRLPETT